MSKTHELLVETAKRAGADAVEVFAYQSTDVAVSERMGKQEKLERSESHAVGLRVFVGKQQAMISSDVNDEAVLKPLAEKAVAMAKASPPDPYAGQADASLFSSQIPDLQLADSIEPDVKTLTDLCKQAEDAARRVAGVTNSEGAEAGYSRHHIELMIAPPSGAPFIGSYATTSYFTSVSVLAGSGTDMEEDYAFSSTRFFADLQDAKSLGLEAGARAVRRIHPKKMPTCNVPIVWDKRVSKSLLGNFLSAIHGSSIARKTSFLKDMLEKQVFAPNIFITDDAHRLKGLGSKPFDGEGLPTGSSSLIHEGVLKSWLLDIRSANQLGFAPTGHASRSLSSPPSASSSNAYIHAGTISKQAMLAGIKEGFYVTDLFGMGVNLVTGDFSQGARGFWIDRGEIAYPVSEITIAGRLQEMFLHTTAADDLEFKYSTNAPTLLVEGMMIAGS